MRHPSISAPMAESDRSDNEFTTRINRILNHPLYLQEYERLQRAEADRVFCNHSMAHFLDVARVCYIQVLEQQLPLSKGVVYAAGLLHDIGKGLQYEQGLPHHEESARLAELILPECGYHAEEVSCIKEAILAHRTPTDSDQPLVKLLYKADKKTRLCFSCPAKEACNWSEEKRTQAIWY